MIASVSRCFQALVYAAVLVLSTSAESLGSVPVPIHSNSQGNVASQLVGGIKDFFVSYSDAFKAMRMDHERCNMIRQKQNRYKAALKNEWEELGVDPREIRTRLSSVNGGVTFDEFLFLRKGKSDREKLISLVFYASFLPKMMPYMLMFNSGNMLPDQFPKKPISFGETKREALSRERSHSALKMLMNLDRSAHVPGFSLNPFGGSKKRQQMELYKNITMAIGEALSENPGPDYVMKALERKIFQSEKPTASELSLVGLPSVFTRGLANAISGNSNRALEGLIPNFIDRTSVLSHIKSVSISDDFLVNQEVDVASLSGSTLVEACSDRLIATLGTSEAEMQEKLTSWLRYATIIPSRRTRKTGEYYNANLARSALMCYYALDSLRHKQSAAPLPRKLMQSL
jgi:LETM1-like protein